MFFYFPLYVCSCFYGQHALLSDVHLAFAGFSATLETSPKALWRGTTDESIQHTAKAVSVDIHFIESFHPFMQFDVQLADSNLKP